MGRSATPGTTESIELEVSQASPVELTEAVATRRAEHEVLHRVEADGKFFAEGSRRFHFRGVTYGTFRPRADGALFPEPEQIERDFRAMREAGFTVVRTYTLPPEDVRAAAGAQGLRLLAGIFYPDWRYLLGMSRRTRRRLEEEALEATRAAALEVAGDGRVLGLSLGNEVPADVLRWHGTGAVAKALSRLVAAVREEDPGQLVTYANYPSAEYLPLDDVDFLTFNVFLERREAFRRYLTRLHHIAGDRPLVLGEVGRSADPGPDGERVQAETLEWQLEVGLERGVAGTCIFSWTDEWAVGGRPVVDWHFGLTRADRSSRPALRVARRWNRRTVRDLEFSWPSISVVICAHNASGTLDECLRHTCALDYPRLEVLVVDDGSTDATAEIATGHDGVRLLRTPHGGLAAARNEGFAAASGDLIAFLDSDAYPAPEWPYYLALGLDARDVGGVGGPNVPPADDPPGAHVVARAPGGPVHVLLSDDRAEHIPGCNMAFWKLVLTEIGGFDPACRTAGDDVDVCWKVLDRDWKIGFHPAALVWHRRRPGLRQYLRQQAGYGRSEALVEARHPDRFTGTRSARWRGRIYNVHAPRFTSQRIYRGIYGAAPYQSVYQAGGHALDFVHQIGLPLAALLLLTAPLALLSPWLAAPAGLALLFALAVGALDAARTQPPRRQRSGRFRFRLNVALHHLLQPLVRTWERIRARKVSRQPTHPSRSLPEVVRKVGGIIVVREDRPRAQLAADLIDALRERGWRVHRPSGWEDYDARLLLGAFTYGDLQTSSHPEGYVQIRVRSRPRPKPLLGTAFAIGLSASLISPLMLPLLLVPLASTAAATLRGRKLPGRLLSRGTDS